METPISALAFDTQPEESTLEKQSQPIYTVEWIERAGNAFAEWFRLRFKADKKIKIFCGVGDTGATGMAVAARLREMGYYVKVYVVQHSFPTSLGFNRYRNNIVAFKWIWIDNDMPKITENDIVVDAILGTGLNRNISLVTEHVVNQINNSGAEIIALDIATGLYSETHTESKATVIRPHHTVSISKPKPAYFFAENDTYIGKLHLLTIGAKPNAFHKQEDIQFVSAETVKAFFRHRNRFTSRTDLGKALLISGCHENLGSAVLTAKSCIRLGVGSLTIQVPGCADMLLQLSVPEAHIRLDKNRETITDYPDLDNFTAIGIGAGIGNHGLTSEIFEQILRQNTKPLIISHDAIEMLCQYRHLLYKIPQNSTLLLESEDFDKLIDYDLEIKYSNDFERLEALRQFSKRHQVNIVFRAGIIYTVLPNGQVYFNMTGNAGLATSGTQDILSGVITSLAAQGYEMWQAAVLGVYLQGIAADLICLKKGYSGWIASELLDYLGAGIRKLEE
jgi:NAD(P)H-hydrate epimerase